MITWFKGCHSSQILPIERTDKEIQLDASPEEPIARVCEAKHQDTNIEITEEPIEEDEESNTEKTHKKSM